MNAVNGVKPKAAVLDKPRARRDASKALAMALSARYRRLLQSNGGEENEIVIATADLAQCMYENIEFILWALKSQGGMNPPPPEELKPISRNAAPIPANDAPIPVVDTVLDLPCTCPPHDARIIGYKHMAACPKFKP